MGQFGIGQPLRRVEDQRLLTGQGRYSDDLRPAESLVGLVVRSPHAHADILSIDLTAAKELPGVIDIFTIEDLEADGLADNPCLVPVKGKAGSPTVQPPRPHLARGRVRHVGEPVAFVVAQNLAAAEAAGEAVLVDYAELPAITETSDARNGDAPQIWPQAPGNLAVDWERGDREKTEAAFAAADRVVTLSLINNRVVVNPLEPRAALGRYDPESGRYTLITGTQGAHRLKGWLAEKIFKLPAERFRVVTPDVGGAFGMKIFIYAEQVLVLWAARRLGRPVSWCASRSESFLSDSQGRDHVTEASLALTGEGKILGLKATTTANMGAYLSNFGPYIPTACCAKMYSGLYDIPAIYGEVACVFTNSVPVDAYRGAGRPEAAYMVERLMDEAAFQLGLDQDEIRRRNFIRPAQLPYRTQVGETYDSGDFQAVLEAALAQADWAGFPARREAAAETGRLRGRGIACYVEACSAVGRESARLRLTPEGTLRAVVGTQDNGQGHRTAYSQIFNEILNIPIEDIEIEQGDSDELAVAGGTGGSRSLLMGGQAVRLAAEDILLQARALAGDLLEAAEADIVFEAGEFVIVGTDRRVSLVRLAEEAQGRGRPLASEQVYDAPAMTYPNGCHFCELEVDPETGQVAVLRYLVVDDFGRLVNPLLVAGQVIGGIAQGLGQALLEQTVYEPESGQLLSGSLMDYALPRADHLPSVELTLTEKTPCKTNPLGIKGAGEAGAIGACPAVMNALLDALRPKGVRHLDMPATAERIWRALRRAEAEGASENA